MCGDGPSGPGRSADDVNDREAALAPGIDGDQAPSRHRRRGRRELIIGGGALAVVLVLVGLGVLSIVRQTDDQTSGGTDDGTMPLLGWRNGTYEVPSFRGGFEYAGTWWPPGSERSDQGVLLSITPEGMYPAPDADVEPITVGGRQGRLLHMPDRRDTSAPEYVVSWEPSPGWTALLAVLHSPQVARPLDGDEKLDLLTRAAKTVRPIGPEAFGAAVDRTLDDTSARSSLIFAADEGRSVMRYLNGFGIVALESVPHEEDHITELCISTVDDRQRLVGSTVIVRGTEGVTTMVTRSAASPTTAGIPPDIGPDGLRTIAWSEEDVLYRLAVDGSVSVDDAVAIADAMRTPTPREWGQLFVVTEPPRLGSDIYC